MPTDTAAYSPTDARNFALRGIGWSLGLFAILRLGWFETHAVLPLTLLQGTIAARGFGAPAVPVEINLACSGADVMALCAGAILAYPARWKMRIAGAAVGLGLILALNTVRIGTLGLAAGSPRWFELLHVYAWPALLVLAVAAYVFAWMRYADGRPALDAAGPRIERTANLRRFLLLTGVLVIVFIAVSPLYLRSEVVLAIASFIAAAAATALHLVGVEASATANVLMTGHGGFLVTQECVTTPLIPVYLAAVVVYANTWRGRAGGVLLAGPLFVGLGIARLLVVALPAALVGSPLVLVHAFYQVIFAGVLVVAAAVWRHETGVTAWRRAALGLALGTASVLLLAHPLSRLFTGMFEAGLPVPDPQGALALLPAFQVGLYVALSFAAFACVNWRRFAGGLALLGLSQIAAFTALHAIVRLADAAPHVRDVRAWALAAPLLLVAAMVTYDRPRR